METNQAKEKSNYIARTSGLKLPDYIGYALGDVSCSLVFGLVTSLLQKFYTDIFLLNPLWIMFMMIAARLWDAINDPIMGRITDTVKPAKSGRYRPWLIRSSLPLAIFSILMFVRWPGLGETPDHMGTFIYATVTYVLFGMAYTMLQIPYGSLASVVTTDEGERNKLSIFRSAGAGIGNLPILLLASFCYVDRVTPTGEKILGENGMVIQDMAYRPVIIGVIIFAILMLIGCFLTFKLNKERIQTLPSLKKEKGELAKILKAFFKNRAFLSMCCASMLLLAAQMFTQSFNLYLFADYFGKGWMNMVAMLCIYAPIIVVMFFTPKLIKKFGKKELCAAGISLAAGSCLLMFAFRGLMPEAWWLYLILSFLSGLGQSFIALQVWALVTDSIDDIEVKSGVREDGTAYAAFMFFRKLGQMIAAITVNGALLLMNYNYEKGAVQSLPNLKVMYDLATLIPAVIFGIMALLLFLWYPLNKAKVAALQVEKEKHLAKEYESRNVILG
ncbi:MAG: glycoside-pentoside-hexuronide (GPH):cation symporter [Clostridia bacterium]|nr:glycoside-pentoside-hexuronide (GPH):cation symporter [Clostridia bacterium]